MPRIVVHKAGQAYEGEVKDNTNLVVRAGIKQFPYPHLKYRCGMGQCGTCTSHILKGAEHLETFLYRSASQVRMMFAIAWGSFFVSAATSSMSDSTTNAVCEWPTDRHHSTGTPTETVWRTTCWFGIA